MPVSPTTTVIPAFYYNSDDNHIYPEEGNPEEGAFFVNTISDVVKSFDLPFSLRWNQFHGGVGRNIFILENFTISSMGIYEASVTNPVWVALAKILEFLYKNRQAAADLPLNAARFSCAGDEAIVLGVGGVDSDLIFPDFATAVDGSFRFRENTMTFGVSTGKERGIPSSVAFDYVVPLPAVKTLRFDVYFDPDLFVIRDSDHTFKVLQIQEEVDDGTIPIRTTTELQNAILNPMFDLLKTLPFKSFEMLETTHKLGGNGAEVNERFWVFTTSTDPLTEEIKEAEVKKFLLAKYEDSIKSEYPFLWPLEKVIVIPLRGSLISLDGSHLTQDVSLQDYLQSSIDMKKVSDTVSLYGLDPVQLFQTDRATIANVGIGNFQSSYEIEPGTMLPAMFIDNTFPSGGDVMKQYFANYRPFEFLASNLYRQTEGPAEDLQILRLQELIAAAFKIMYIDGVTGEGAGDPLAWLGGTVGGNNLILDFNVELLAANWSAGNFSYTVIKFKFLGTEWTVLGPHAHSNPM